MSRLCRVLRATLDRALSLQVEDEMLESRPRQSRQYGLKTDAPCHSMRGMVSETYLLNGHIKSRP